MTGFLRSVLIRGIGPSAAGKAQFATVPARSHFSPRQVAAYPDPGMAEAPKSDRGQPPQMTVRRPGTLQPEQQPLRLATPAQPTPAAAARDGHERTRARVPDAAAPVEPSRHQPAPADQPVAAQPAGEEVLTTRPVVELDPNLREPRGTPQSAIDPAGMSRERDPQAMDPSLPERAIRPEQLARARAPAAIATRSDSGTTIEIGRIDIVVTPSPAAAVDRGPDRASGFATHEQRRLGPRR